LGQGLQIGAGFVIKSAEVGVGDEFKQVLIAGEVFGQKAEVVVALTVLGAALFLEARAADLAAL
jgi:hypothetical protein